jgi:hypothetical protein
MWRKAPCAALPIAKGAKEKKFIKYGEKEHGQFPRWKLSTFQSQNKLLCIASLGLPWSEG